QVDAAIEGEVALAEFEKAAKRLQDADALLHRLAAQRIEHDIDPGAAAQRAHPFGKPEIARIEHVIGADQVEKAALYFRSRGGDDDRAAMLGVLDRRQPDTAGAAMDQHQLA